MEPERYFSVSEKIKAMILDLWKTTEEFYYKNDEVSYVRATKSLARVIRTRVDDDDDEIKKLNTLEDKEATSVKDIEKKKDVPSELKEKEVKKVRFECAEERMNILTKILEESSIL